MKKLTLEERAALSDLMAFWIDHSDRCDNIQNRKMAEKQKARDLVRVSALNKVLRIIPIK